MANNDSRSASRNWTWIALFWIGLGLFDATQTVFTMRSEGMHHAWVTLFWVTVVSWLPWAVATPFVLRLGGRLPTFAVSSIPSAIAHLAAWAAIGLTFSAWTAFLELTFNPYAYSTQVPFPTLWLHEFSNAILSTLVLYAGILSVRYAWDSRERLAFEQTETARLNQQLSSAQLDALRRQIEPHFLFNTLNAIAGLVRGGQSDSAVRMIAVLSDFLRRMLDDVARQQVPLHDEMEFAQTYLEIQKVRFADRLQLRVDVPSDLGPAQVPSLILQPLVENAVKHGIAKRSQGGEIAITASRHNGTLTLTVCNDGPALSPDWETARPGIGIANVRSRLESLYGNAFEFRLRNQDSGGVEVSVSLPFVITTPPSSA
jgi:two-component system LytT family sensor kinase